MRKLVKIVTRNQIPIISKMFHSVSCRNLMHYSKLDPILFCILHLPFMNFESHISVGGQKIKVHPYLSISIVLKIYLGRKNLGTQTELMKMCWVHGEFRFHLQNSDRKCEKGTFQLFLSEWQILFSTFPVGIKEISCKLWKTQKQVGFSSCFLTKTISDFFFFQIQN